MVSNSHPEELKNTKNKNSFVKDMEVFLVNNS